MAGPYNLNPVAPRVGMTRRNEFASLHGDIFKQKQEIREPSPSIYALPRGSSSDEELDGQDVQNDGFSDDSDLGRTVKNRKVERKTMPSTGTDCKSAKGEDIEERGLSVEPSNIRAGNFTSGKGPGSRNGSQSSQKRKSVDVDDDDLSIAFSQSKKSRQSYGSVNKYRNSLIKLESPKKGSQKDSNKSGPAYKDVDIRALQDRVDRLSAEPDVSKRSGSWEALSTQTSSRDQRASQRSRKSTQESSQKSTKGFKQPPRPSPRKIPEFKASPLICEEVDSPQATRFLAPAGKKPPVPTEPKTFKLFNLRTAVDTATDKLGISNMPIDLPPSAPLDSSAPPTSLDAASTVSSPLSSLDDYIQGSSDSVVPIITSEDMAFHTAEPQPAVCPMCRQPVEQSYLEGFTKVGTRMSLRQQAQFCKAHKERSAESEWTERGYPIIDWQQLDARIANFHTSMDDILSTRKSSFYRNAFEDTLKSGKNKTIQECLIGGDEIEGMSPGYYGGRGAKVMADNIMSRFSSKLRRLAASDKLISSGGVSRYVQAVLVPELAVLLVMDDMNVDEEEAREVLRDSVDIGNLLNEEEDEVIMDPVPKEQEIVEIP